MSRLKRALALAIALLLIPHALGLAVVPPPTPEEGLLVLRNGRVLRGRITRIGDRFAVALGENGEIRLPANRKGSETDLNKR